MTAVEVKEMHFHPNICFAFHTTEETKDMIDQWTGKIGGDMTEGRLDCLMSDVQRYSCIYFGIIE